MLLRQGEALSNIVAQTKYDGLNSQHRLPFSISYFFENKNKVVLDKILDAELSSSGASMENIATQTLLYSSYRFVPSTESDVYIH